MRSDDRRFFCQQASEGRTYTDELTIRFYELRLFRSVSNYQVRSSAAESGLKLANDVDFNRLTYQRIVFRPSYSSFEVAQISSNK